MWTWAVVSTDACEISFIGVPINVALVMVRNEYGPLFSRQFADPLLAGARGVESNFVATLAIDIGAGINRISEHMIDPGVAWVDPTDFATVGLQRIRQTFAAEPDPDAAHGSELDEVSKHRSDRCTNSFIRMEADLPIFLPPNEANGKAASQFATSGLVTNTSEQSRTEHMQLSFAHGALEAKHQTVVEQRWMIYAVTITDESVCNAAEIEQTVPIGVVASQSRDLQTENDSDMAQGNFGSQASKTIPLNNAGSRKSEVFIDNEDLLRIPTKGSRFGDQSILPFCRFAVVLDLSGRGLPKVDVRGTT